MASKLTYVLFALLMTIVTSSGVDPVDRQKRGDDYGGALSTVMNQLSQQLNAVNARQDKADARQNTVETRQNSVETRLAALEAKTGTLSKAVAFHALQTSDTIYATPGGVLIWDHPLTNVGQGYDPTTGVFTAPIAGDYAFLATIMQGDIAKGRVDAEMIADNVHVARALAHDANTWSPSSIHAVVHLHVGSKVLIRNGFDTAGEFYGNIYSTFSGFLIKAES